MIGRAYSVVLEGISVAAIMDLIEITAAAGKPFEILSAEFSQDTSESSEQLVIALYRLSANGTTGATTVTPRPLDNNNTQAFGGSAKRSITAQGARSPAEALWRSGQNVLNGWRYAPVPEERIDVSSAGIIAFALIAAPAVVTPILMSATVNIMEY